MLLRRGWFIELLVNELYLNSPPYNSILIPISGNLENRKLYDRDRRVHQESVYGDASIWKRDTSSGAPQTPRQRGPTIRYNEESIRAHQATSA